MRRVVIGTGNAGKAREMEGPLRALGYEAVPLSALEAPPDAPEETGATFEDNARLKALHYARATGEWTLADDSGLEVEALDGRPGVYSARFAGPDATDAANNGRLLRELEGVPPGRRAARYVAVLVLTSPERVLATARGTCRGEILEAPRGGGGFGYDPLFFVPEEGGTFAELPRAVKARLSHRAEALRNLSREIAGMPHRHE
jgi:XTP/dITP diphosphohydrolase